MLYNRKAIHIYLGFLLMLLCSCGNLFTGDETPTETDVVDPEPDSGIDDDYNEALPVMIAFNPPNYTILTRGQGALSPDDEGYLEKLENADFHVYAFRSDTPKGGMNYGITRESDKEICLIDGSTGIQGQDASLNMHGKKASYTSVTSFAQWQDENDQPMYSQLSTVTPFDFFAYYIDDLKQAASNSDADFLPGTYRNFTRNEQGISFEVAVDGSQDLISAVAELTEDEKTNIAAMPEEERNNVMKYYYSTYTARRNITPVFNLRHQLAHVRFNIKANMRQDVMIKSIGIESIYKGKFTVAGHDFSQIGVSFNEKAGTHRLELKEADGNRFEPRELKIGMTEIIPSLKGTSLLVPPSNSAVLIVEAEARTKILDNPEVWDDHYPYTLTYPLKDMVKNSSQSSYGFLAGWRYTINITISGPEEMEIKVEIEGWENGGDIEVDGEDMFE